MTYILQLMIGIGIGIISAVLLTPLAIGYVNNQPNRNRNSNRSKQSFDGFFSKPEDVCPICLCTMEENKMQYLPCCHALHEECFKQYRALFKHCPTCRKEF